MESVIFLGVVAAIFVAWLLFQKLVSTTVSATTKVVARGSIEKGQELVRTSLEFTAPVEPAAMIKRVREKLNLRSNPPAVLDEPYIKEQGETWLKLAVGSMGRDNLLTLLAIEPSDSGCAGGYVVLEWAQEDGLVGARKELGFLQRTISDTVTAAGGQVSEVVND